MAGWLLLAAPIGFIAFQFERMRDVRDQQFAGVWDQRIEVMSFLVLPPNVAVLAPAILIGAVATWFAGSEREPWLKSLLPIAGGLCIVLAVIGVVSIISIVTRPGAISADLGSVFLRVGGISFALGLAVIGYAADRITA
ncbi:MAG: hypothetical protein WBP59_10095 [Ilumatobacteraceae bacterium]